MVDRHRISYFYMSICALVTILAIAVFPGKSALEGDQRTVGQISDKSDNWGFMTAFLYGEWPNFLGEWRFTLILFQLAISVSGFLMLTSDFRPKGARQTSVYCLIFFVSAMFSVQLWRDASLYSFSLLGLGLINFSYQRFGKIKIILNLFGWVALIFASMFKPVLSLALLPIICWLLWQNSKNNLRKTVKIFVIPLILLATIPSFLDESLTKFSKMQPVYPEQQPIILDLAMNYCWGQSDSIRSASKIALMSVVKPNYPVESLCAATNPFRWDDLHTDPKVWMFSNPINRITGENAATQVRELISDWASIVVRNPADWLQVRLLIIGPVLFMSNSFVSVEYKKDGFSAFEELSNTLWKPLALVIGLIDKMRFTSLFFLFLVQLFLLKYFSRIEFDEISEVKANITFSILSAVVSFSLMALTFLAPNGRYVLPYILLNYILLYRSLNRKSQFPVAK